MVRLKDVFWAVVVMWVAAGIYGDFELIGHLRAHRPHVSNLGPEGERFPGHTFVLQEDGTGRDIPAGPVSDYDRGFNDALSNYSMLVLATRLFVGVGDADQAIHNPNIEGVTYGQWQAMNYGDQFDVLRRMYGVEKAEAE